MQAAEELRKASEECNREWELHRDKRDAEVARTLAKVGVESPQELLKRVRTLRGQIHDLKTVKTSQQTLLTKDVKEKEAARQDLLRDASQNDRAIRDTRVAKAKELTAVLGEHITVELVPFGDRTGYKQLLSDLYHEISSKELRIKNIDAQLAPIADTLTPKQLAAALMNKGLLRRKDGTTVDLVSLCSITPNTQIVLCAIGEDVRLLNRLQTAPMPDVLKISVKRQGENVFADLSTGLSPGEQSAALLTLALQSRKIPLIIDQPEDELGYSYVVNLIVPKILRAKLERQMLIITHNANVPVLGDADLVVKMENKPNPDGGRECIVAQQGCFESKQITATLLELEGGRRAFEFRQHRYALADRSAHSAVYAAGGNAQLPLL
ncbi:MAG: hypothetical protein JSU00_28590 [Acidobacteria bacterium]|nr:hypothetical protein [Acidobacteriota bacterium]